MSHINTDNNAVKNVVYTFNKRIVIYTAYSHDKGRVELKEKCL